MSSIWKNELPPPPGFTPQTWPQRRCSQNIQIFMMQQSSQSRLQKFPIRPALDTRTYSSALDTRTYSPALDNRTYSPAFDTRTYGHLPMAMIPKNQINRSNPCVDPNHLRKSTRKAIADETLSLLRRGSYELSDGTTIDIQEKFRAAVDGAICYPPDYYFIEAVETTFPKMLVEVTEETTLQSCQRLHKIYKEAVGCLAFTSAKNPGGGFLGGSGGQEESIARSSGYYDCLLHDPTLYEFNRKNKTPYHSDHIMVSKDVPVIREEVEPYKLCEPWEVTVISAPAVNAGIVRARNLGDMNAESEIHRRMRNRIRRILGAAYENGVKYLVLGQYGCGALENNPYDVARYFRDELINPSSPFKGAFLHVVFAICEYGVQNNSRQRGSTLAFSAFNNEFCPRGNNFEFYYQY